MDSLFSSERHALSRALQGERAFKVCHEGALIKSSPQDRDNYRDGLQVNGPSGGHQGMPAEECTRTVGGHQGRPDRGWPGPLEDLARRYPRVLVGNASLAGKECQKRGMGKVGRVGHAWRPRRMLG